MNTVEENGVEDLNVHFPSYNLSDRAATRKENGKNYISHKDNFAITTISSSRARSLEHMKLSELKPLSGFEYVKQEGSDKEKDILDHDPFIGVLQLGKTPSTGKFWLVREKFTWTLATKPCLKLIVTFSVVVEILRCFVESTTLQFIIKKNRDGKPLKEYEGWQRAVYICGTNILFEKKSDYLILLQNETNQGLKI